MANVFAVAENMTADFALDPALMGAAATFYGGASTVGTACYAMRSYVAPPQSDEQGDPLLPATHDFILPATLGPCAVGDVLIIDGKKYVRAASAGGQCAEPATPETGKLMRVHAVEAGAYSPPSGGTGNGGTGNG